MEFQARFRFLRDLIAGNDSMMLLFKLFLLRSKVSRFSNLNKLSKPVIDLLKEREREKKRSKYAVRSF
jgi:hypothetical protein